MSKPLTIQEAGSRGGQTTVARHGRQHMSDIAHKAGTSNVARHGRQHMAEIGAKGAKTRWDREKARRKQAAEAQKTKTILGFLTGNKEK